MIVSNPDTLDIAKSGKLIYTWVSYFISSQSEIIQMYSDIILLCYYTVYINIIYIIIYLVTSLLVSVLSTVLFCNL